MSHDIGRYKFQIVQLTVLYISDKFDCGSVSVQEVDRGSVDEVIMGEARNGARRSFWTCARYAGSEIVAEDNRRQRRGNCWTEAREVLDMARHRPETEARCQLDISTFFCKMDILNGQRQLFLFFNEI